MVDHDEPLLTNTELELMLILWNLQKGTVHDVLAALPKKRAMAYTTASTIIRILNKKGFVESRKEGKAHIYSPTLTKQVYESRTLGHVVGRLFKSTPSALVARLVNDNSLTKDEIKALKKLLDDRD